MVEISDGVSGKPGSILACQATPHTAKADCTEPAYQNGHFTSTPLNSRTVWNCFLFKCALAAMLALPITAVKSQQQSLAIALQGQDHVHEEDHREFNDHGDESSKDVAAEHTHEHRHSPDEPAHSHHHQHGSDGSKTDSKIAFLPSVHRFVPSVVCMVPARFVQDIDCKGFLRGIFRPPIV